MQTEAHKKASRKWDAANRKNVTCRLSIAEADAFASWCASQGKTCNAVLAEYVRYCIRKV